MFLLATATDIELFKKSPMKPIKCIKCALPWPSRIVSIQHIHTPCLNRRYLWDVRALETSFNRNEIWIGQNLNVLNWHLEKSLPSYQEFPVFPFRSPLCLSFIGTYSFDEINRINKPGTLHILGPILGM